MSRGTLIRTIVLLLAIGNQLLTSWGKNPLPWSEEELYEGVSAGITALSALVSWWKNNSFTKEARLADQYLKGLKAGGKNGSCTTTGA